MAEKYYPNLNREFFSINPSLSHRSIVLIRCLKCGLAWEVDKELAKKESYILQFLNHEYKHRSE